MIRRYSIKDYSANTFEKDPYIAVTFNDKEQITGIYFPDLPPRGSLKDKNSGIELIFEQNSIKKDGKLSVTSIKEQNDLVCLLKPTFTKTTAFEVFPVSGDEKIKPTTAVTISIPLPEGYHAESTEVYLLDDKGAATKKANTVTDGIIYFKTIAFGKLVIVDTLTKVQFEPGKVDKDDTVSSADARLTLRASVGLETYLPFSREFSAADIDNDGIISAADARMILRASVGLEKLA